MTQKLEIAIDFPPQFAMRWGRGKPAASHIEAILAHHLAKQLEFSTIINSYVPYFEKIAVTPDNEIEPGWNQVWFPPLDGMSLYTLMAHFRPVRYFEIGSGNSTKFAYRAIRDHATGTRITSIDPHPRAEIDKISNDVVRQRLESVDPAVFDVLQPNDVVLFDGSHRSFMNSDVSVFFIDILPRLKPGIIVGIHDIFWPDDYPEGWLDRYYNEQYLLGAYMLAKKNDFPLLFSCYWMATAHSASVSKEMSPRLLENLRAAKKGVSGGCCWFLTT